MTFPRVCSLALAVGGSVWALLLLCVIVGYCVVLPLFSLFLALVWMPSFVAWYGYIRRALGHFLFRRALVTWSVSIIANGWALYFLLLHYDRTALEDLPVIAWIQFGWLILAIILSVVCLILEWRVREPKREVVTQATEEEFTKLLDEHRRKDA